MESIISNLTSTEIDTRIATIQKELADIQESSRYLPKNAKDLEELENTLHKHTRELADLIAAKKNPGCIKKR